MKEVELELGFEEWNKLKKKKIDGHSIHEKQTVKVQKRTFFWQMQVEKKTLSHGFVLEGDQ